MNVEELISLQAQQLLDMDEHVDQLIDDCDELLVFLKRLDKFDFVGGVQGEVRREAKRLLKKIGRGWE